MLLGTIANFYELDMIGKSVRTGVVLDHR